MYDEYSRRRRSNPQLKMFNISNPPTVPWTSWLIPMTLNYTRPGLHHMTQKIWGCSKNLGHTELVASVWAWRAMLSAGCLDSQITHNVESNTIFYNLLYFIVHWQYRCECAITSFMYNNVLLADQYWYGFFRIGCLQAIFLHQLIKILSNVVPNTLYILTQQQAADESTDNCCCDVIMMCAII